MIGHHKLVLHKGINDIDALVLEEKLIFTPFFRIKVCLSIGTNTDSRNNLHSFHNWAP